MDIQLDIVYRFTGGLFLWDLEDERRQVNIEKMRCAKEIHDLTDGRYCYLIGYI
jgi:hypothetical protein